MEYKIGDEVKFKQTGLRCIINKFETNMRHEDVVVLIGDEGTLKLDRDYFEKSAILIKTYEKSSVEIRLYNHKTGKVLYENLNINQLEHILKVLDPKGWQ